MITQNLMAAKQASRALKRLPDNQRNAVLLRLSEAIIESSDALLSANSEDLARMDKTNPLYDRLKLNQERLEGIASDIKNVASLPSPSGRIIHSRTLPNGLQLQKRTVPFGVIGIVYEARPNVTFDVFSLCFKSGNAAVLKGGRDADFSNKAAVSLIRGVLKEFNLPEEIVTLLPATHQATADLLNAVGLVDLVIPRGGRSLINFVRDNAKVPCIETGAGVVNCYMDASADLDKARAIITNAKTRRVSVCNALDCLILHSSRLADLYKVLSDMPEVSFYADPRSYSSLEGKVPSEKLHAATEDSFGCEYMDYKMSIKTVDSIEEAINHIHQYGSGHSEAIITEDPQASALFQEEIDAACVYVNAPTSFTDGAQFGLGAEIGISTQKLGARGPMALEELNSYKWLIVGNGQIRK